MTRSRPTNRLSSRPISVDPMIDQSIGNDQPPMFSGSSSPSPSLPANQAPNNHPMKPITIEPRTPPLQLPVIACPMAPQIPTSSNNKRIDSTVITIPPSRSLSHDLSPEKSRGNKLIPPRYE